MEFISDSARQTEQLAEKLALKLQAGDVIAFYGGLGAGKTAFIRGLAAGLGASDAVTSPTYTIVNEYLTGRLPLFHFDMYRLSSGDELFDIGWEDYLQRGGVCAVEWTENVEDAVEPTRTVTIRHVPDAPERRIISISGGKDIADLSL